MNEKKGRQVELKENTLETMIEENKFTHSYDNVIYNGQKLEQIYN